MPGFKPVLSESQWELIEPLLPTTKPSAKGGRTRADERKCFEGILWVLRSGARWPDMPDCFPSPSN